MTGELDESYKGPDPAGKAAGSGPTYNIRPERSEQPRAGEDGTLDHQAGTAAGGPASLKPKGANVTEGGFQGDEPNASFHTDIGSENDPGRAALNRLERTNFESAVDAGAPTRQQGVDQSTGGYEGLKETDA